MEDKNIIIILAVIVVIIAIAGYAFATGMFNGTQNTQTSPLKTEFMEGNFVGDVKLVNDTQKFMHSYEDKQHHITYNISTVDNSSALMEIYELQGVTNPEERSFNGQEWNIYFTQAMPGNNTTQNANETMNIIICQSQGQKQGYLIYAIFNADSDVNATGQMFSPAYKEYIEPLLKSISLKESKNVPKINEEFGLTEDEFAQQMDLIHQYKAGNRTALEG
ncbi:hypothetical protein [uncultured Methanobrevibacter sp.]|uniref:hypothetical protein n=1 Tax=uncultured Methanobrevibacter sp. TaxID=253161 RepID=UPI0025DC7A85|nr:hypothetical protein [uncultured Methanobrevibacter sp.]